MCPAAFMGELDIKWAMAASLPGCTGSHTLVGGRAGVEAARARDRAMCEPELLLFSVAIIAIMGK